jgi:hypothetical protein
MHGYRLTSGMAFKFTEDILISELSAGTMNTKK